MSLRYFVVILMVYDITNVLFIHCDLSYIVIIKTNWLEHKEPLVRYSNIMASGREMNDHDNYIMSEYGIYIYVL